MKTTKTMMAVMGGNETWRRGHGRLIGMAVAIALGRGAAEPVDGVTELRNMVVTAEPESAESVQPPFLPPVDGTRITSGKKSTVTDLDYLPPIINNNYRSALIRTPGLVLSEETTPLVSVGYRGLSPNRSQFTQVLKDGIPIHADQFGYPEAYYTPPLDTVDRLEFVHGGAGLMYGPQPGGALNFVTHRPRTDREFGFHSQQVGGTDSLFSSFNSIDGTVDRVGYYGYYNRRQSDGFRQANSDFNLNTASVRLVLDEKKDSRWTLTLDGYGEDHGEPGGLALTPAPGASVYSVDRTAVTRPFDRFKLRRYQGSLVWEKEVSDQTAFDAKAWGGYYSRYSRRQRGGGFGTLPTGPTANSNTIERQEFYTQGVEGRIRHHWSFGGHQHTFSGGAQLYHVDSPRTDRRGAAPDAITGVIRNQSDRGVLYAPVFAENRFTFGEFSITPGVRLESVRQEVKERVNLDKTGAGTALGRKSRNEFEPLMGLGVDYNLRPGIKAYGNLSESYRPMIFTESVPTGPNAVINQDLEAGRSWMAEAGFRGDPTSYFNWDVSLFRMDFDNQIGSVAVTGGGTSVQNVGRAVHQGGEVVLDLDLIGWRDAWSGGAGEPGPHEFHVYGSAMFLKAEFESGPRVGQTPQYAPDYLVRAGVVYRWRQTAKVAINGTFVDGHFGDDANTANFRIPGYVTWDLLLEWKLGKSGFGVVGGINNFLDRKYYARVTGSGIDPAYRRNFYVGMNYSF